METENNIIAPVGRLSVLNLVSASLNAVEGLFHSLRCRRDLPLVAALDRREIAGLHVNITERLFDLSLSLFSSLERSQRLRVSTLLFRADQREFLDIRNTSEGGSLFELPACSWCEKVLLPEHEWQEIESAAAWLARGVSSHRCRFSYTVCPQCKEQVERQLRLID